MPPDKPTSPEKQLLNLIEKQAQRDPQGESKPAAIKAATIKYQSKSFFSLGAFKGRLSFFKSRMHAGGQGKSFPGISLHLVNNGLEAAVFLLAGYFIFQVIFLTMNIKRDVPLKAKIDMPGEIRLSEAPTMLKALSYYLEKSRERDIFKLAAEEVKPNQSRDSQKVAEVKENLKLVGISWSADPDIMIEDTKTKRTFFLKRGSTIDDTIRINAVFKDKVVLECEGQEIELK